MDSNRKHSDSNRKVGVIDPAVVSSRVAGEECPKEHVPQYHIDRKLFVSNRAETTPCLLLGLDASIGKVGQAVRG